MDLIRVAKDAAQAMRQCVQYVKEDWAPVEQWHSYVADIVPHINVGIEGFKDKVAQGTTILELVRQHCVGTIASHVKGIVDESGTCFNKDRAFIAGRWAPSHAQLALLSPCHPRCEGRRTQDSFRPRTPSTRNDVVSVSWRLAPVL